MRIDEILKPEYCYQPRLALRRLLPFRQKSTAEFVEQRLPWGLNIRIRPLEEHGIILSTLGVIDLVVSETLWRLTEPGELVVDVGANIGYMTSILAAKINSKAGGHVWGFEAHPEIFAELLHNVDNWQKQLQNCSFSIKNIAISDQIGNVNLRVPDSFSINRGLASVISSDRDVQLSIPTKSRDITVKSHTLDEIFIDQNIGVLKIDVEGHELQVIQGAKDLLEDGRIRDCVFEEHREYPTPVTTFFETLGYSVFRIHRHFKKPVLLAPDTQIARTHWQPTSFLATLNLERAINSLNKSGWQVLTSKKLF